MGFHLKTSSEEYRALYEDMRKTLAGVPWLPGYLRDRILKARAELEAADEDTRTGRFYHTLAKEGGGFGILRQLKTPESIKVLGEFLTDHRGAYDPKVDVVAPGHRTDIRAILETRTSNSQYAVGALMYSALENKPLFVPYNQKKSYTLEEIAVWQRWYERIKAGHATFRFEGDPTEYDLDGPASPEKLARIKAARQRDEERRERHEAAVARAGGASASPATAERPENPSSFPLTGTVLGVLTVLAALAWYFIRRWRANA
jgi:hypothetical protein